MEKLFSRVEKKSDVRIVSRFEGGGGGGHNYVCQTLTLCHYEHGRDSVGSVSVYMLLQRR